MRAIENKYTLQYNIISQHEVFSHVFVRNKYINYRILGLCINVYIWPISNLSDNLALTCSPAFPKCFIQHSLSIKSLPWDRNSKRLKMLLLSGSLVPDFSHLRHGSLLAVVSGIWGHPCCHQRPGQQGPKWALWKFVYIQLGREFYISLYLYINWTALVRQVEFLFLCLRHPLVGDKYSVTGKSSHQECWHD